MVLHQQCSPHSCEDLQVDFWQHLHVHNPSFINVGHPDFDFKIVNSAIVVCLFVFVRAISSVPFSLFFPVIPWLLQILLFGWFVGVLAYLLSLDEKYCS